MHKKMKRLLMEQANDGGDPAASVGGAAGDGGTPGAAGVGDGSGAGAGNAGSLLAGAAAAGGTGPAVPGIQEAFTEKYRVLKEDGTFDLEASARKLAEGYSNLEKRMGSGEAPPKSADEYQIELPEGLKFDELKADPEMQDLLKAGHEAGLNNKQMNFVVNKMLELAQGGQAIEQEQMAQALRSEWKTDAEYNTNMGQAYRAATQLLSQDELSEFMKPGGPGDNPAVIKLLAKVGREMSEDSPPAGAGAPAVQDVKSLMASEAYTNPAHPDYAAVNAKVRAHYEKTYGKNPVS